MKLSELTYKKKFFGLIVATVATLVLAYFVSFSKTYELWQKKSNLELQIQNASDAQNRIAPLKLELQQLESVIGSSALNHSELRQLLVDEVQQFCSTKKLRLVGVDPPHQVQSGPYDVSTHILKAEGPFSDLIGLTAYLENDFRKARLVSQSYHVEKDKRTRKKRLYGTYYIQVFRKT